METKQIATYLIIAGAVILVLKLFKEVISFILSDFLLGLGTILLIVGAVLLSMKFIKENKDDAKDEPFRGIDQ
jgi:membrane-bound ClpP family serine protease